MDTPTNNDLKAQARFLVEEMYQKGLRALEAELTVGNYEAQMAKIEKYKQIHRSLRAGGFSVRLCKEQ